MLLKKHFMISVFLFLISNCNINCSDNLEKSFVKKTFNFLTSSLFVQKPQNSRNNTTNIDSFDLERSAQYDNDVYETTEEFDDNLFNLTQEQSSHDSIIQESLATIKILEDKELEYISDFENYQNELESLREQIKTLTLFVREHQIAPIIQIPGNERTPSIFSIIHTNELDKTEHASIACGPYMISFLFAMLKIVHDRDAVISKTTLEAHTKDFFIPTDHTLDPFEVIDRINNFKNTIQKNFSYIIINHDTNSKNISYIDPEELNASGNPNKPEDNSEIEIKNTIQRYIQNEGNKLFYFLYRTGNNIGMGHWSIFTYVLKPHTQHGLYYIDNMNQFVDSTIKIAKKIQELLTI